MARFTYLLLILLATLVATACTTAPPPPPQTPPSEPHLRVVNVGETAIEELIVSFPGTSPAMAIDIPFGNLASNQTTAYQPIPTGVYRYAAYKYTLDGATVHQPVMDWVGEEPLAGTLFTYQILLDETKVKGDQIRLVAVLVDD